ncbi:hypothetical protein [Arcobacter peruensis]|uniref:hypothetical protein n=1 Tax=Arcobacter peruensis TaxID=2320140 RepID=UPI000F092A72|nr:hypothetical protein [Arcobacter peruensis]
MKKKYIKSINNDIKIWTHKALVNNLLFCKDEGSIQIVLKYMRIMYPGVTTNNLPPQAIKDSEKVRRYRNIILKDNPPLDKRLRYKPKKKALK